MISFLERTPRFLTETVVSAAVTVLIEDSEAEDDLVLSNRAIGSSTPDPSNQSNRMVNWRPQSKIYDSIAFTVASGKKKFSVSYIFCL